MNKVASIMPNDKDDFPPYSPRPAGGKKKVDQYDDKSAPDPLIPQKIRESQLKKHKKTAIALEHNPDSPLDLPKITAAGREKIAEQILNLAFANGVRVREDAALTQMLASVELDSPIPSQAFLAVAEILSHIYKANGQDDPFDAILGDINARDDDNIK